MQIYVVKQGDSIDAISQAFHEPVAEIAFDNQIFPPYRLAVGQALLINSDQTNETRKTIVANGYAYPFIDPQILANTLPFLTSVSVFSYGFTPEGELIPPEVEDVWMINEADRFSVMAILTLTPFGEDGKFNNALISALVNSPPAQERLFYQLAETMAEKGFRGLDIDFEYILAEDKDAFSDFVREAVQKMNELGYPVSVALAPKISDDQVGTLYEGKDYQAIGAAANSVLLMTYEWGYKYGENMAVAPLHKVREVLEYAVTVIPHTKIDLGIPNYGYDWPLPWIRGETEAETIGNIEAVQIAVEHGAEIQFDEVAMSPFFRYEKEGIEHEVWFEDVRSMKAKFELMEEYDLRGCGYWQLMRWFRANWLLLADTFWIV